MLATDKKLKELKNILDEAEAKIAAAKRILFEQVYQEQAVALNYSNEENIVEGIFDGEEMIDGLGKKYPVSSNYASKSKLVAGDRLKLVISPDGTFVFKQIGPTTRKHLIGVLEESGDDWYIQAGSKKFKVLLSSVRYFKAKPGDEVTIIIPKTGETNWAAIENCLGKRTGLPCRQAGEKKKK